MKQTSSPPVERLPKEDSPGIPDPYLGSWDCDPATDDLSVKIAQQGSQRVLRALESAVGHFQMKAFGGVPVPPLAEDSQYTGA